MWKFKECLNELTREECSRWDNDNTNCKSNVCVWRDKEELCDECRRLYFCHRKCHRELCLLEQHETKNSPSSGIFHFCFD